MKISSEFFYKSLFAVLLFSPILIASIELNAIFIIVATVIVLFHDNFTYSKTLMRIVIPLLVILVIAIFSSLFFLNHLFYILKDVLFMTKPILFICIGFFLSKKIKDRGFLFKILVYGALFFAVRHIFLIIYFINNNGEFNINMVRNYAGRDNAIEIFALVLLITKKGRHLFNTKIKYYRLILLVLITSIICYFSRTLLVSFVILLLSIKGYLALSRKGLLYILSATLVLSFFYLYLSSIDLERNAAGIEGFLYKLKIAPSEIFNSTIDRADHEDLWDHWRAYEAHQAISQLQQTPINYGIIAGKGVGSLVDLEFIAPLTSDGIRYITTLHNGYAYIIFKAGFIGLIFYFLFLFLIYSQVYLKGKTFKQNIINALLSGISVYYIFTTLIVSGPFNPREVVTLILGGLLFHQYLLSKECVTLN